MTSLAFHIGMHKTGSTAIQLSFRGLDNDEALFPTLCGQPNHTVPIFRAFASDARDIFLKRAEFGRRHDDLSPEDADKAIMAALEEAKGRTLILSSEGAYNKLTADDWKAIRARFEPHVEHIRIIAYARPPVAFASSMFQQVVKGSQMTRFKVIVKDYGEYFEPVFDAFGEEAVEIVPFRRGVDVVKDFAGHIGIAAPPTRRSNEAIGLPATAMLYAFNRMAEGADSAAVRSGGDAIAAAVNRADDPRLRFADSLVEPLVTPAIRDWCQRRMGEGFLDLGDGAGNVAGEADLLAADPGWREGMEKALDHPKLSEAGRALVTRFISERRPH